jgi:hypothetical protein
MKQVTFTRAEVLRAVRYEPLQRGTWIQGKRADRKIKARCKVCAVGAVIRRKLRKAIDYNEFTDICRAVTNNEGATALYERDPRIQRALDRKKYLLALSQFFESLDSDDEKDIRKELVTFVKSNFPIRFKASVTFDSVRLLKQPR